MCLQYIQVRNGEAFWFGQLSSQVQFIDDSKDILLDRQPTTTNANVRHEIILFFKLKASDFCSRQNAENKGPNSTFLVAHTSGIRSFTAANKSRVRSL